jgi:hypothetical protein
MRFTLPSLPAIDAHSALLWLIVGLGIGVSARVYRQALDRFWLHAKRLEPEELAYRLKNTHRWSTKIAYGMAGPALAGLHNSMGKLLLAALLYLPLYPCCWLISKNSWRRKQEMKSWITLEDAATELGTSPEELSAAIRHRWVTLEKWETLTQGTLLRRKQVDALRQERAERFERQLQPYRAAIR